RDPDTRLYRRTLDRADWEIVDGLPTTTAIATIRDLAATTTDGGHLAGVIRDAILRGKASYLDVATALRPYAHDYGAPLGDGRTPTKTLLAQAGLTRTITAATRFNDHDDAWLISQLQTAAARQQASAVLTRVAQEYGVTEELLGAAGVFGLRPPPRDA